MRWQIAALLSIALISPWSEADGKDANTAWQRILRLDQGPQGQPQSIEGARLAARNHFLAQSNALRNFISTYPQDARVPQAQIRLAAVLATEGKMDGDKLRIREAGKILQDLTQTKGLPEKLQSDAAFQLASLRMQTAPGGPEQGYKHVIAAATDFIRLFPKDRRGPRLLTEAATVCDAHPETKRKLLLEARKRTSEKALHQRINDDLRRLDQLGKPVDLALTTIDGGSLNLLELRGKPLILIFWSTEAPQSLLWLRDFRRQWQTDRNRERFNVAMVNLDTDRNQARERAAMLQADWPIGWEAGGWEAPSARQLGINALPTVWLLDSDGRLLSLNVKSNWSAAIQQMSAQR